MATTVSAVLGDQVLGIDHVGIATADLDASIAFYVGVLGLRVSHREINTDQGVAEAMVVGGPDDPREGGPGGLHSDAVPTAIQLVAPHTPESALARFLDRSGPGIHHLAVRVRSIEVASRLWSDSGRRLLYDRARPGTAGSKINFIHPRDAGGVLVELVEPVTPER